ncbi:MAG: hypothetical protein EP343_01815 [Deltaproteobacteria bacterium]|nr:MAG: hypothetical protein EP343_01815 [Deltaproteobacteria bacterium]
MSRNNQMMKSNATTAMTDGSLMQRNAELQGLGFEIFGEQEFVRYPVIGVNQPTSDYKPEGKFHNRVTGDVYDQVEVVFLALRRSMAFRPHGYSDPLPTCYSSTALRPDSSVEQPIHHTCHRVGPRGLIAECPNAQWLRTNEGKPRRACDLKYTAAIDLDGNHYLFYLQGRSIAPLERFLSQMRQLRQPLFGMRVNMGLTYRTKKEGFLGNFYELNFPDLTNQSERDRVQVVDAMAYQEAANFFKDYFDSAPSELYHEGSEEEAKEAAPLNEGVRFESSPAPETQNPQDRWGRSEF